MKTRKIISLVLILCLLLALCACGQHSGGPLGNAGENTEAPADPTDTPDETAAPDDGTDEPDDGTDQPDDDAGKPDDTDEPGSATGEPDAGSSPADVSAAGMENFIKKLSAGNYVVSGNEDAPQTNAVSPDQIYIVYGDKKNTSQTFAFMTLNGETFQAMIDGNGKLEQIAFLSTDNAIACLGDLLPNCWITLTGNIWDLFYNNPENPLEFTSNDGTVKKTLAGLGGFGQFTLSRMEEVHMVLDAQDPETVHFTAVITDAYPVVYDDLDVTLRFGAAKENNRIKQWMNKPEYPAGRTEWTENDIYLLESIYNRDYGDKVLPFPAVSTYAMNMEEYTYQGKPGFLLTDPHWTEKDVEDYRSVLKTFGYTEESGTLTDGSTGTVYRKLLRGDYKAYAQLSLEYDNGLVLAGTRYYDAPSYDGLAAISGAVQENGFAPLPETDLFTGWRGTDTANADTESWGYYFEYSFYLAFPLHFEDAAGARAYIESYAGKLSENGFIGRYIPGENNGECSSPNGCVCFSYKFSEEGDDTVSVIFKVMKTLSVEETLALLRQYGLPETDLHGDISSRDVTRYYYEVGQFTGLRIVIYQPYKTAAEAQAYLDQYVVDLEKQGYLMDNPQKFNCYRNFLYFNEQLGKFVAFDLNIAEDGSATIFYEMVSFDWNDPAESIMMKAIRR